jgi:hypothetical protein
VSGISPLNILFFKLQRTTMRLNSWSKRIFGNARIELHTATDIIYRLDMAQGTRSLSSDECDLRRDLKLRMLGHAVIERARRRQASRMVWLKEGDAYTHFCHLKANSRSRKKLIPCLRKSSGEFAWALKRKNKSCTTTSFASLEQKNIG